MSDEPPSQLTIELRPLYGLAPARLHTLAGGTLAYTAAGWLDLLAGNAGTGNPLAALVTFALLVGGTILLVRSLLLLPDTSSHFSRRARRVIRPLLLAMLALCGVVSLAVAANLLTSAGDPSIYDSDAAVFNQYNATLVLHGKNPYTADSAFWDALAEFPSVGATPLRAGRYAGSTYGPTLQQVVADTRYEQAHLQARGPEYDPSSLHSYPALAFLIYVPSVWAGLPTTLLTSLFFLLAVLLAAGWGAPREARPIAWLLLASCSLVVVWTLRGSFEVVALLPALLAWRLLDRRTVSPILLGLACAVKQLIWPLVPLYAILIWRREGPRAALRRLALVLGAFLAPNLPFLLASPGAWARSMLLPMTLPIFPSGVGLVGMARAGLLPLLPPAAYAVLELAALLAIAVWLARARRDVPPVLVLILGLLPFALSWHSLFTYFMCIPILAAAGISFSRRVASPSVAAPPAALAAEDSVSAGPMR